jgi:hypothetical protein
MYNENNEWKLSIIMAVAAVANDNCNLIVIIMKRI